MPRGKRRSQEEIRKILKQLEKSGQGVSTFAKANGLAVSTLDLWRRKDRAARKASSPRLRRVSVVGSSPNAEPFEIQLPEGPVLRVPANATAVSTEAMLKAFLSACSR